MNATVMLDGQAQPATQVRVLGTNNLFWEVHHEFHYSIHTILMNNIVFIDIIECGTNNGGCAQNCTNTEGSYYCTCDAGYQLSSDGHSCLGRELL